METVVLTAKIDLLEDKYVARIDELALVGEGESLEAAQDDLIQIMRAWIESHDGTDTLSGVLAAAGYPGVDEDTELQLEFAEAALATDGAIAALDDAAFRGFRKAANSVRKIGQIVWVNPDKVDERAIAWLEKGARIERSRQLRPKRLSPNKR